MEHILLTKDFGGWSATFTGNDEILTLFGTNKIPTAFTRHSSWKEVLARFQKLYPNATFTKEDVCNY